MMFVASFELKVVSFFLIIAAEAALCMSPFLYFLVLYNRRPQLQTYFGLSCH